MANLTAAWPYSYQDFSAPAAGWTDKFWTLQEAALPAAVGAPPITAVVALSIGFSAAASAQQRFLATTAETFGLSLSAAAKQAFKATGAPVLGFAAQAAGKEVFKANGAAAFGLSVSAAGQQRFLATAAQSLPFSVSAQAGSVAQAIEAAVAISMGLSIQGAASQVSRASGALAFSFWVHSYSDYLGAEAEPEAHSQQFDALNLHYSPLGRGWHSHGRRD